MTTSTAATTTMRPASALLEGRFGDPGDVPSATAELDLLAVDQQRIAKETAAVIARMDDPRITLLMLDDLTDRLATLLVRAEGVRAARARAAARRSGDVRRWQDYLDLA